MQQALPCTHEASSDTGRGYSMPDPLFEDFAHPDAGSRFPAKTRLKKQKTQTYQ